MMADIVVSEGYAAAGYEYINVDDCWLEKERNTYGQLVPDRQRFPRGMKSLADYVSPRAPSPRL
jgi:alpha-N-acetylgalactosaminidase